MLNRFGIPAFAHFFHLSRGTKNTPLHSWAPWEPFLTCFLSFQNFSKFSIFRLQHAQNVRPVLQSRFWFANSFELKLSRKLSHLGILVTWQQKSGIPKRLGKLFTISQNVRSTSPKKRFLQAGQLACRSSVIPLKLAAESCSARFHAALQPLTTQLYKVRFRSSMPQHFSTFQPGLSVSDFCSAREKTSRLQTGFSCRAWAIRNALRSNSLKSFRKRFSRSFSKFQTPKKMREYVQPVSWKPFLIWKFVSCWALSRKLAIACSSGSCSPSRRGSPIYVSTCATFSQILRASTWVQRRQKNVSRSGASQLARRPVPLFLWSWLLRAAQLAACSFAALTTQLYKVCVLPEPEGQAFPTGVPSHSWLKAWILGAAQLAAFAALQPLTTQLYKVPDLVGKHLMPAVNRQHWFPPGALETWFNALLAFVLTFDWNFLLESFFSTSMPNMNQLAEFQLGSFLNLREETLRLTLKPPESFFMYPSSWRETWNSKTLRANFSQFQAQNVADLGPASRQISSGESTDRSCGCRR